MANDDKLLNIIPNSVSGDGKSFVSKLKNFLRDFSKAVNKVIEDKLSNMGEGGAEQLVNLRLTEEHTTDANGMPQNNIKVEYDNTNITDFSSAQIWIKEEGGTFEQVGSCGGVKYIIANVSAGVTYTVKVVAVNKQGGTSIFDKAPQANITIKGSVLIPATPRQFILNWDEEGALWEWLHDDNGYVDFFELRLDAQAGTYNENLLDRTRAMFSRANPNVRSGTAYLFVRNIFGGYSLPAVHQFSKPVATKPKAPVLESTLDGVVITMDALPSGYQGWKLKVNEEEFVSYNRQFTYYQFSGTIEVEYCFFDYIGDGEWSDVVSIEIKTGIDVDELPVISYDAFDQTIKDAIDSANAQIGINEQLSTAITQTNKSITSVVAELNKDADECSYSAITQLQNGIDLSVKDADFNGLEIISRINISPEVITIDGKYVHVTGDTVFDKNVIVGGYIASDTINTDHLKTNAVTTAKIAANAITADKIKADSITSEKINDKAVTTAKIEDGAITTTKIIDGAISSTKIEGGAVMTEHILAESIISDHISANAVTSSKIAAGAVEAEQLSAGAVTTEKLSAKAVSAEKMNVETLSAITATIGTLRTATEGARTEIKDNLIEVYDENNVLRVRMGVWS